MHPCDWLWNPLLGYVPLIIGALVTTRHVLANGLPLAVLLLMHSLSSEPTENVLLCAIAHDETLLLLRLILMPLNRVTAPVSILRLTHYKLMLVNSWDLHLVFLDVDLVGFDHRYQNRVGLPELGELLTGLDISLIERILMLEILQHLLIPYREVLHLLPQRNDSLLHLILLHLPDGLHLHMLLVGT